MKKLAALLLLGVILVTMPIGCGKKDPAPQATTQDPAKGPAPVTAKTDSGKAPDHAASQKATFVYFGSPG